MRAAALSAACLLASGAFLRAEAPEPPRLVCAHLMHQMSVGAECLPGEGPLAAKPSAPESLRGMPLPEYLPNYRRPLDAARQDISVAAAAGVNTFTMLLGPDHLPQSQFASVIRAYWKAAAETDGFRMGVDIWLDSDPGHDTAQQVPPLAAELALLRREGDAAWRRVSGKYLVLLQTGFRQEGAAPFSPADLETLFAGLGGRKAVYLVLYDPVGLHGQNPALFAEADAFTDWPIEDYGDAVGRVEAGAAVAREGGKPYWYPAMPSFAQSRPQLGQFPNVREKLGMANFVADWERAIAADAPAVCLDTWNDLSEDSSVMPETNHGRAFHELSRLYAARFLSGRFPDGVPEEILLFHHPQVVESLRLPSGRAPMAAPSWAPGATPPTDCVGVVACLARPATVSVQFGEKVVAEREFPAGVHSWLLYHPSPASCPAAYPSGSEALAVTALGAAFGDAEVYVGVSRQQERIGLFRSHRPILAAAGRGELVTIGDVLLLKK